MPDSQQPAYPGPWSKSERLAGIKLDSFVKWWSPERCEEITANWVPWVDTGPMTFEEEQRDERFWQAIQDLRHDLDRARESGWTFGELPKDIRKEPEPFSATMEYEFIENVCLQPLGWCAFDHDGKNIKVRVFPPGRFEDKAEDGSGRGQNIVPPRKAENATGDSVHDHALQLFGAGEHFRGGKLGDIFDAFMLRRGHGGVYDDPIFNGADWVFDERLPGPGVVPLDIYMSAPDHGDLFLTLIRQGARSGLACEPRQLLEPIR